MRRLLSKRAELDEAALTLPVLILVSLALVNLAMLGFAAINAANAAEYGARMGSVAITNVHQRAYAAAWSKVHAAAVGSYTVSVSGGTAPGTLVQVAVTYTVPNYFGGLARLFGVSTSTQFQGTARAYFRKEGW